VSHRPTLIRQIVDHPIALLIGLIAAILALLGAAFDALAPPDISADPTVDSSRPFAFQFIVKNASSLFDMRDAEMFCG
jgi:hypothetical protein